MRKLLGNLMYRVPSLSAYSEHRARAYSSLSSINFALVLSIIVGQFSPYFRTLIHKFSAFALLINFTDRFSVSVASDIGIIASLQNV